MPKVILASSSVQRKKLLEQAGISFEIIVSNADETPVEALSFCNQLKDISMRKALTVMNMLDTNEDYIIVAGDQNILFNGIIYGKPETIDEARKLIKSMQGSQEIYAYTGNTVLHISNSQIITSINECDIARLGMDTISDEDLEQYLRTGTPLSKCGGINILETPSLYLLEGRLSTAKGLTVEYLIDMLSKL